MNIEIKYSKEDNLFIAKCNKYPSITTHGDTELEALNELHEVLNFIQNNKPNKDTK